MTDHTTENEYTSDDILLDELLARTEEGVLEALSSRVDPDAGLADIFFRHPPRRTSRRTHRPTAREPSPAQETRRP
ncbi:hypothetical protein QFW82_00445 [Streptomyces malaysiensis subsp. malaysiensis]|uniref:hypothetical protein n=1 Tax=Streptomyces malaysiensis TaxID=92644 RepID=UPI0024BF3E85|nr:hypothetical protein [Streptomyces sp. NA07423]WHX15601.1 hypothetical protein QFW82_00445 [Streptomyces sp. NA07423]